MSGIVQRLREPSTWAGIGAIVVALGLPGDIVNAAIQALIGVAGLVAVLLPERPA